MTAFFGLSRYAILIAVVALLVGALAVFIFGGITTVSMVIGIFQHAAYNAEGARAVSMEFIELIDLFLLGTVLIITAVGLYELFIDPKIELPESLSVKSLEQLKFNLLAVVIVMLSILFLGGVAARAEETEGLFGVGIGIAAVIAALGLTVYAFARVHHMREEGAARVESAEGERREPRRVEAEPRPAAVYVSETSASERP